MLSRVVTGGIPRVVAVVTILFTVFVAVAGWLDPGRLTPARVVDALSDRDGNPIGHRRNHAKGICFDAVFEANGAGARFSTAPVFARGSHPVIGRFAIATGNPLAPDASGRVRSMAIQVTADGEEWRSGMNSSPVFAVSTAPAFYAMTVASDVDPHTRRPDPARLAAFLRDNPEARTFTRWAATAPWTGSYAEETYSSLNAFRLVATDGTRRPVRWSMRPEATPVPLTPGALARQPADFLETDLLDRLSKGPLRWTFVVTFAAPGDRTNDATQAWPAGRDEVEFGTLTVHRATAERDGACRPVSYDPLILPRGIEASDDPLLAARSSAYRESFNRRAAEAASRQRDPGNEEPRHAVR